MKMQAVSSACRVGRTFQNGGQVCHALREVNFVANAGELVVLRGRSGSGKTTLLNLLAGLDRPTQGEVYVSGKPLSSMNEAGLDKLRQREIGMVFQSSALFPFLSAQENVELALRMGGKFHFAAMRERCLRWLTYVGLEERLHHRPAELSGGEQQRVAIARALVREPALLLADEPTAALDFRIGQGIIDLFERLAGKGICVVLTSHDPAVIARAKRVYTLEDGKMAEEAIHA